MFCLQWALDIQSCGCYHVVGDESAIRQLYGILLESRERLSHAVISSLPDGTVIQEYSKKDQTSQQL